MVIFENEFIKVKETGRDHDFVAVIINKTNKNIIMQMDDETAEENCIIDKFEIPANDYVGLCNWEYYGNTAQALEQGDYEITFKYYKVEIIYTASLGMVSGNTYTHFSKISPENITSHEPFIDRHIAYFTDPVEAEIYRSKIMNELIK